MVRDACVGRPFSIVAFESAFGTEIMVRARGLGRALGRVIGRGLGRENRDDSDDASQRRRPTPSARRQRKSVLVAADEPVVPAEEPVVGTNEPVVDANVHAKAAVDEPKGFPGGPSDPSVLIEYTEHVTTSVWSGEGQKLGRFVPAIEGLVAGTGLSPLIACSIDTGDQGLISSFVERWHRENSSFHLPMGEVTITLDDMASLLHLPIVGAFHIFQPLQVDETVLMLVDLLLVSGEAARAETTHCHEPYIGRYAWGAAVLVHMYDHLNNACISTSQQLVGYITLLQCWIHEHFLSVAECIADPDYDEVSPCACRWIATKKTVKIISIETYSPRVSFDFMLFRSAPLGARCCQTLNREGHAPVGVGKWASLPRVRPARIGSGPGEMCVVPGQCVADYMDWFFVISHPFMTAAQPSNPPRDPLATHDASFVEPHIPQILKPAAASTHARSEVDEPRHAVACHAIAERLERNLNLRIVTPSTKTHEVMEQRLKIARGVIEDHIVYVRSRRRWCTDQP
ncbi:Protein MAIN-LIKE 1 [Glycine max]|nr:Protein MAIN-LIKE 1 [Glycine max]